MNIGFDFYPGGKRKAVTLSYDDGQIHDRRLIEIMNKYGVKGSFHLNSSFIGKEGAESQSRHKRKADEYVEKRLDL